MAPVIREVCVVCRHLSIVFVCIAAVMAVGERDLFAGEALNRESKKGLQVQLVDDALALGIHHAAINVNLLHLATINDLPSSDTLMFEGGMYAFNREYINELDGQIKPLAAKGVIVYLIIVVFPYNHPDIDKNFVGATYNTACPNRCASIKTDDVASSRRYRACIDYLAQRYARPSKAPMHFIVGNEINSHWFWYNMGDTTMEVVAADYERAVRQCYNTVHAVTPASKVFISLDQNWSHGFDVNQPTRCFGARPFLEHFNTLVKRLGDFPWHVTTHPYAENMFDSRTWNDKTVTHDDTTAKITFKNIDVAHEFMKRPEMLYEGKPRRIVLAEQGFHSTDQPDGESIQAAAFAYAYYKISKLDGIDAFIYHRHVDHGLENGLNLGLWSRDKKHWFPATPARKKIIYDVFKKADTPEWEDAFNMALPIIGITSWNDVK